MASTEWNGEFHSVSSPSKENTTSCESSGSEGEGEGELLQKAKDTATTARDKTDSRLSRLLRYIIIMWLLLAYLATNVACSLITPFYPQQAGKKGVSSAAVGLIIASTPLTIVILSPVTGYLLPRIGVLLPIAAGLTLVGISYISLAFVVEIPSAVGFIMASVFLRVTEGVGSAMYTTSAQALALKLFPKQITVVVGLFRVACGVGYSAGFVLGGVLYQVGGFKLPFLSVGSCVLALMIPCALVVRNIKYEETKRKTLPLLLTLNFSTDFVFVVLVTAIIMSIASATFYSPDIQPYLDKVFGLDSIGVAGVIMVEGIANTLTTLLAAPLVQKLGNSRYFSVFGLASSCLGYLIMGLLPLNGIIDLWSVRISFVLFGTGVAFGNLPMYANLITVAKRYARKGDSETALISVVAGLTISATLLGDTMGLILGGTLNSIVSFPESMLLFAELLFAEVFLLTGVTVIDQLCPHSSVT